MTRIGLLTATITITALSLSAGLAQAAPQEETTPRREPEALAIMERADAALAAARVLEYDFERTGTHSATGRTTGHAVVERSNAFQGMRYRASITAHVTPGILRRLELGPELELASDGQTIWSIDHAQRIVKIGPAAGGATRMQLPAGQFMVPLMFRPLQSVEIDLPERMSLAGRAEVGGVECDVVYLDFPDDSGFGEQYFYVGREDHLPRRIVFVASTESATTQFDFVMTDLKVVSDATADAFRLEPPSGYRVDDTAMAVAPGAVAEGWEMETASGKTVRLEDLRGKTVVLEFFASWCPYCRNQMPMLTEIADELEGLPVEFYAVNAWEDGDPLAFVEEIGGELPVILEGDDLAARYRIEGTATVVIIDPEGRFRPRLTGIATREMIVEAIRSTLPDASAGRDEPGGRAAGGRDAFGAGPRGR